MILRVSNQDRRKDTGLNAAHIHPVMKQYAARGIVDCSGSTVVMR